MNFLLLQNIGKVLSDLKILSELQAVEINISFYWFSNRSPLLTIDGNSTKVPTSNTNFSDKYHFLKVTIRM